MVHFVVDARAGGRTGYGEEVDGDPGEDLVGGPGVGVCPVVEFFVDPGEEGEGAVVEAVAEGLGFRALDFVVAVAFAGEPGCAVQAGFFVGGVGGQGVLEG